MRDQLVARCGSCAAPLFSGKPLDIQAQNFDLQTSKSDIPVLVDVWAPWCGPCRAMAPAFTEAAKQLEPAVRLVKLNADEAQDICSRYAIRGIPALLLFHRGTLINQTAGAMDTRRLITWTRNSLSNLKE
ncbi:MAG: thioredoxin [Micropepsaceae bacterium]